MSDAERLGAAVALALFFHFLIILYQPADTESPVTLTISITPNDENVLNPGHARAGTALSSTPATSNEDAERRDKKRKAYLDYLDEVDSAIHARRLITGRKDLIGVALCAFTILPDGTFTKARIIKSSGDQNLDSAALNAVKAASGIIKRPEIIGPEIMEISMWVKFQYDLE